MEFRVEKSQSCNALSYYKPSIIIPQDREFKRKYVFKKGFKKRLHTRQMEKIERTNGDSIRREEKWVELKNWE